MNKIIRSVLLIFVMMNCFVCFGQSDELHFIIDTTESKYYRHYENQYNYYNNEIVTCKIFYDYTRFIEYSMYPIHFEFTLLKNNKYYCTEYDDHGNKKNEGVAKKELKPYNEFDIPIIDSNGVTTGNKKIADYYKLYKDEFWKEDIDSGQHYTYSYGKYRNGKKDSIWIKVKRGNVESETKYQDGIVVKNEIVNLTGTSDKRIADVLIGKWKLPGQSFSVVSLKFKPDPDKTEKFYYIEFSKNGTYKWYFWGGNNPGQTGKWKLTNNKTLIILDTDSGKVGRSTLEINYISKYGLDVTVMNPGN